MPELDVSTMKLYLASVSGLSKETLHVCIGLIIFGLTAHFLQKRNRLRLALQIILIVALFNEFLDFRHVTANDDPWNWFDALKDVILSVMTPVALVMLSRHWRRWHQGAELLKLNYHT